MFSPSATMTGTQSWWVVLRTVGSSSSLSHSSRVTKIFIVRYLFDSDGRFLEATIHDLGQRSSGEPPGNALQENADAETLQQQLLAELGNVQFGNIKVRPFSHASNGTEFGLIAQPPEDDEDEWTVVAEPGNYMAFYSPWDDGEYDT